MQELCYFKSADRKEAVDLAAVTVPLYLRRTELGQETVTLQKLIKVHFYPPELERLAFHVPAANALLGRSYHIKSKKLWGVSCFLATL